jgi:hypothetical protein
MKKTVLLFTLLLIGIAGFAQSKTKRKQSTADLTQEQRLTKAQDKKTKGGKKQLTMEKKVKVAKKQDKKARKIKTAKKPRSSKPKM